MAEHTFAQVPSVEIPRSSFSRDHGHKTTLDAGWLVPIFVDEALPGDTFSYASIMCLSASSFGMTLLYLFSISSSLILSSLISCSKESNLF